MYTAVEQATGQPRAARLVRRRTALQFLGFGAGVVAVAGATGLTWRAVDGGVFATGTGPAYDAWSAAHPTGPGGRPLHLIRAAVLAANAHNTQPWLFTVTDNRIEVFADMSRTIGAMDPLLRELHISLSCALENLTLAGRPNGLAATVTLIPDPSDTTHIATVSLTPTPASGSPLFDAIAFRHTNRGAYDTTRPVGREQLDTLSALVDVPDTRLIWLAAGSHAIMTFRIGHPTAIAPLSPRRPADDVVRG
jgi:nitroreductase